MANYTAEQARIFGDALDQMQSKELERFKIITGVAKIVKSQGYPFNLDAIGSYVSDRINDGKIEEVESQDGMPRYRIN